MFKKYYLLPIYLGLSQHTNCLPIEESNNNTVLTSQGPESEGISDRLSCLVNRCENDDYEAEDEQTWNDSVYDTLLDIAPWSKIAYCQVFPWSQIFSPGSLRDSCPNIEFCSSSTDCLEIIGVFKPNLVNPNRISGSGYVAVDHCEKKVYITFRGTASFGDWLSDITIKLVDYKPIIGSNFDESFYDGFEDNYEPAFVSSIVKNMLKGTKKLCDNCRVHLGVYYAYSVLIKDMYKAAKPFLDDDYQLIITGQSLGGGFTHLAAIDFLIAGYKPLAVSFAALRVANGEFNTYVDNMFNTKENADIIYNGGDLPIPSLSRVYQQTDIVPRLPPGKTYTHSGLQFEITKIRVPHLKKNVHFKGASDNWENDPFEYHYCDPQAWTVSYQHHHQFIRHSIPCNDVAVPTIPEMKVIPWSGWTN